MRCDNRSTVLALLVAVGTSAIGCSGRDSGASTPEEVVKGILNAAKANDVDALEEYYPRREVLSDYLDCAYFGGLVAHGRREPKRSEAFETAITNRKLPSFEYLGQSPEPSSEVSVTVGEEYAECRVIADFKIVKASFVVQDDKGAKATEPMAFYLLDGKYYAVRL